MKEYSYGMIPYLIENGNVKILLSSVSPRDKEWGFVKGKIERLETLKECAVREVYEEIGIRVDEEDLEEMLFQKNKRKDIGLFYVDWTKYKSEVFKLEPRELYMVKWFNVSEIQEDLVYKNQRKILLEIKEKI